MKLNGGLSIRVRFWLEANQNYKCCTQIDKTYRRIGLTANTDKTNTRLTEQTKKLPILIPIQGEVLVLEQLIINHESRKANERRRQQWKNIQGELDAKKFTITWNDEQAMKQQGISKENKDPPKYSRWWYNRFFYTDHNIWQCGSKIRKNSCSRSELNIGRSHYRRSWFKIK